MGMYTQIRGWLNVDSIGDSNGENFKKINNLLESAKESFQNDKSIIADRKWVCKDTIAFRGSNDSVFLFIGSEIKNYDSDAEKWIEYLITYFPNAEGRIDLQYEEYDFSNSLIITEGKIVGKEIWETPTKGYGNSFK